MSGYFLDPSHNPRTPAQAARDSYMERMAQAAGGTVVRDENGNATGVTRGNVGGGTGAAGRRLSPAGGSGQTSGTPNPYGANYANLQSTNPQYAAMLDQMGAAPQRVTVGPAGAGSGGMSAGRRTGASNPRAAAAYGGGGEAMLPAGGSAGFLPGPDGQPQGGGAYANHLAMPYNASGRPGVNPAATAGRPQSGTNYSTIPPAATTAAARSALSARVLGSPGAGGAPTITAPSSGGGITSAMAGPVNVGADAGSINPMDPYSVTNAQQANQRAAIEALQRFQTGVGSSALAQNVEGLAAGIAANPESIDDATQQAIETRTIETARAGQAEDERLMREDLGAAGRLGTGTGIAQLGELRRRSGDDLRSRLTDLAIERRIRGNTERREGLGAASGALGGLAGIGGATASKIADILNGTDIDDQTLQRYIFSSMLGAGGGYGISG